MFNKHPHWIKWNLKEQQSPPLSRLFGHHSLLNVVATHCLLQTLMVYEDTSSVDITEEPTVHLTRQQIAAIDDQEVNTTF